MAYFNSFVTILALGAILAVALGQIHQGGGGGHQGGPHQNQGRIRRQVAQGGPNVDQGGPNVEQGGPNVDQSQPHQDQSVSPNQDDDDDHPDSGPPQWTSCNITVDPILSCADCNSRVICKPIGGLVLVCRNPRRPYCNNGLCSPVPTAECA